MLIGRRLFLGGLGVGIATIATGGRLLPRIALPWSDGGWRIYNVAGSTPSPAGFRLRVDGLVDHAYELGLHDLLALPVVEQTSDFECVTGWRVDDVVWRGYRMATLLDRAGVRPGATHVRFHSRDGVYTDTLSMAEALEGRTILAAGMNGRDLPLRHGGPLRLVVPAMYGYKSVKWLGRIEVTDGEVLGYWERRGYAHDARISTEAAYDGRRVDVPGTGLTVEVPEGWAFRALPGGGATASFGGDPAGKVEASVVALPSAARADRATTQSLLSGFVREGMEGAIYGATKAGRLRGDTLEAGDGTGQRFLFAFFPDGRRIIQVLGQAPSTSWSRWGPWLRQLAASIRAD